MRSAALQLHKSTGSRVVRSLARSKSAGRVVMCGSMSFLPQMYHVRLLLEQSGLKAVMPDDVDPDFEFSTQEKYAHFKREVSLSHMRKVHHHSTDAILVANFDKHGIRSYIGPNTFAEVAIAFFNSKTIYLLNGVPDQYRDELVAWGAKDINGELDVLVGELSERCQTNSEQLRLPEF